jgi:hypothetical protein
MSPVHLMAQESGSPAEQTPSAPLPTQPTPEAPAENSPPATENPPPAQTPPPQEILPTTPESTAPPPASSEPAPKSEAPAQPAVPSEETGSSAESVPPPPSPAKPSETPPPSEVYKNYFKKGTIRIGAASNLMGSITQFNQSNTESEQLIFTPSAGYYFRDNWEINVNASIDYVRFTDTKGDLHHGSDYSVLFGFAHYFNLGEMIVPYLGAALGFGHSDATLNATLGPSAPSPQNSADGIVGEADAGLKFLINPSWSLDLTAAYQGRWGDFDQDQFFGAMGFSFYIR